MKKYFYLAAVSAMMLTACSSDKDVLQPTPEPSTPQVVAQQQAVGFDVYVPAATAGTRSGLEGTMTTNRLQRSDAGFGVYAFLTEDDVAAAGDGANATAYVSTDPTSKANVPNFMVNEQILWNTTNLGWAYSPLKYWPNETDNDSQNTSATMEGTDSHLDRLTFFAYAPYVSAGSTTGITNITDKDGLLAGNKTSDPTIAWKATTADATFNPNEGVDLLWGVAPAGGLSYTAVNKTTKTVGEGLPLIDMVKPDVNTSMKFLFQHALARIGINVVAAVDQVSPGGELDPNTKITINSLKITGPFGTSGELNLYNAGKSSVANWTKINSTVVKTTAPAATNSSITVTANNATPANNYIAKHLRWAKDGSKPHEVPVAQPVVGVTTAKQDLLAPSTKWYTKLASVPAYNPAKIYYTESGGVYTEAKASKTITGTEGYYEKSGNDYNAKITGTITSPDYPEALSTDYFTISETSSAAAGTTAAPGQPGTVKLYTKDGSANYKYEGTKDEVKASLGGDWTTNTTKTYFTIQEASVPLAGIAFTYPDGTYYEAERNYLYVVPTNAALDINYGTVAPANEASMRTIEVQIEYYINTKDDKLAAGFAETKNVITKTVVLPSLANGKSYMLNLVLGLTSVKIEAEVDDWKVENVNADLPQNTAE